MNTATADEFDTHMFVKNMTGKGMPESQAEELAGYMKQHQNRLVTREHLDGRLAEMETRLTTRMLWVSGGMAGLIIAVLGMMMQNTLAAG